MPSSTDQQPPATPTDDVPEPLRHAHFVGLGGAGMSGLAKILALRGAAVSGSDARDSTVLEALRQLGVATHVGHAAENLPPEASALVVSSAIRKDNPELVAAEDRGLPVLHRSQALARLMDGRRSVAVAGTHGKTTTTSMLSVALSALGLDPSFAIGGDLDAPGSNAHHGVGDVFVAEADESDRSFHRYSPEVAVVLNVELDHHANYASIEEIHDSFAAFVDRITPGGTLVVSADDPGARELTARVRDGLAARQVRVVTVGDAADADVRVLELVPRALASELSVRLPDTAEPLPLAVSVPGRHYAHNAVAALAAGVALGVPAADLAKALTTYTGVRRRLQLKGAVALASEAGQVRVIDSYAHHPTEIAADLAAIREGAGDGRLLVVFQPHLFSRTERLGAEMGAALAAADLAVVMDIYPAREDPVPGVTSDIVAQAALARGGTVRLSHSMREIPELLAGLAMGGDSVLTMGAGDVTFLGPQIVQRLRARAGEAV